MRENKAKLVKIEMFLSSPPGSGRLAMVQVLQTITVSSLGFVLKKFKK